MTRPENPPAYPLHPGLAFEDGSDPRYDGMSLRDYFAGQALSGTLANDATIRRLHVVGVEMGLGIRAAVAQNSYEYADAMLAERAK